MGDHPILFSAPMVRALLAGTKTQTRRIVPAGKVYDDISSEAHEDFEIQGWLDCSHGDTLSAADVRVRVGDRLWVREAYSGPYDLTGTPPRDWDYPSTPIHFWADGDPTWGDWTKPKPAIHMPRWASRLTLTVTDVRVERLQDISDEDAEAEGCPECSVCDGVGWINSGPDGGWQCTGEGCGDAYRDQYARLWDTINGPGSWDANPWVAAYSFSVAHHNIDNPTGAA